MMSSLPSPFESPSATFRADEPILIGEPDAVVNAPRPFPIRICTCPLIGLGGEPQQVPHGITISRKPSLLRSAVAGSPAIGPTAMGALARLKTGCFAPLVFPEPAGLAITEIDISRVRMSVRFIMRLLESCLRRCPPFS